jgi:hypothetical protein
MPSLYQPVSNQLKLFSLPAVTVAVSSDSGCAFAILATQAANPPKSIESAASVSNDGLAMFESLATAPMTSDTPLPIEGGATVRPDHSAVVSEELALQRGAIPGPIEWSGSLQVVGDTGSPLEMSAASRGGSGAATEFVALLLHDAFGPAEWLGSGAAMIGDAMLPFEGQQAVLPQLLSLESGPGRLRLLATPGRLRLARRS